MTISFANTTSNVVQVALTARSQFRQAMSWMVDLSQRWKIASHHHVILQTLAANISPTLFPETVDQIYERQHDKISSAASSESLPSSSSPSPSTFSSSSSSSEVQPPDHLSRDLAGSGSSDTTPHHHHHGDARFSQKYTRVAKVRSIDAFWNEMPIGEDLRRWNNFTNFYFA